MVLAAVVVAVAMLGAFAAPATATDGLPHDQIGGTGALPGVPSTGTPSPGGGGGDASGGDQSGGGPSGPLTEKYYFVSLPPSEGAGAFAGSRWNTCARLADGRFATGVSYWEDLTADPSSPSRYYGFTCVYPPNPVLTTINCPIWMSGTITGPHLAPKTLLNTGRISSDFAKSGQDDLSACATSWVFPASATMKELGKYSGQIQGQVARCTRRDYPDSRQEPDIKPGSCALQPIVTWNFRGAIWCDGASNNSWPSGHSWTMDECLSGGPGAYQCVRTTKPTYGGSSAVPVPVFHDGKKRPTAFPRVRLTGDVRNVKANGTTFSVSGTPLRKGVGLNASTQPFVATKRNSTSTMPLGTKVAGDVTGFDLAFQGIGMPGKDFTVTKKTTFTAQFLRNTIRVTALDLRTGQMVMTSSQVWVTDSGSCSSLPLKVQVLRARNSSK